MVSEHDIGKLYRYLLIFPNSYLPLLEFEIGYLNSEKEGSEEVSSFYKKIKEKLGLEDMDDKENHEDPKTFIKESMEGVSKIFMQGL